ncbi:MAG: hypothetical protein KR126chlam6_00701 [Candidatus Anoxychlamydiales bacterium]|nr:hypothetical protein [Candidatus Anoxychlamydiales bacterium]
MGMLEIGRYRSIRLPCEQDPPKHEDKEKKSSLLSRVTAAAMGCFNDPDPSPDYDPSDGFPGIVGGFDDYADDDYS